MDNKSIKDYSQKVKIFVKRYAFHSQDCSYYNNEFCSCGYRDRIIELRNIHNKIISNIDWNE